jgi:flavin reductase (DIM6/NTAB) family NADH-FMN oxidoreductase RutF
MAIPEPLVRPADDREVDRTLFRQAFRRHAASVVVVTYLDATGSPRGMTATSMCALSADPPSLLVCIDRATRTHEEVMHQRVFAVDMLSVRQRRIGIHCAQPGADKRLHPAWLAPDDRPGDPPRLARSVAHLECTIESALDAFTHTVVVGRIRSIWRNPLDPEPLLYHDGDYARLMDYAWVPRPLVTPLDLMNPREGET